MTKLSRAKELSLKLKIIFKWTSDNLGFGHVTGSCHQWDRRQSWGLTRHLEQMGKHSSCGMSCSSEVTSKPIARQRSSFLFERVKGVFILSEDSTAMPFVGARAFNGLMHVCVNSGVSE